MTNITKQIQHDHFPEMALNGGAYKLAEQLNLNEFALNDPTLRRKVLGELDSSSLIGAACSINASVRGLEEPRGFEDGRLPISYTPKLEDKEPLLREAADAFSFILNNPELEDKAALRRAGLTLAGALNYIHPFSNGNGRTARIIQYFTEFGAERGSKLFEAETYSAIGKIAVVDSDMRLAVDTTPVAGLERSLLSWAKKYYPDDWMTGDNRDRSALAIKVFLAGMSGRKEVTTTEQLMQSFVEPGKYASLGTWSAQGEYMVNKGKTLSYIDVPVGTNIAELYEAEYQVRSFAANIIPEQVNLEDSRVLAKRPNAAKEIYIPIDFVE